MDGMGELSASCRVPILLGFNAADQGKAIEASSDATIVASAMKTLRTMFGKDVPDPIDTQSRDGRPIPLHSAPILSMQLAQRQRCEINWPLPLEIPFSLLEKPPNATTLVQPMRLPLRLRAAKEILALPKPWLLEQLCSNDCGIANSSRPFAIPIKGNCPAFFPSNRMLKPETTSCS